MVAKTCPVCTTCQWHVLKASYLGVNFYTIITMQCVEYSNNSVSYNPIPRTRKLVHAYLFPEFTGAIRGCIRKFPD
jgi:hypothetical protein